MNPLAGNSEPKCFECLDLEHTGLTIINMDQSVPYKRTVSSERPSEDLCSLLTSSHRPVTLGTGRLPRTLSTPLDPTSV